MEICGPHRRHFRHCQPPRRPLHIARIKQQHCPQRGGRTTRSGLENTRQRTIGLLHICERCQPRRNQPNQKRRGLQTLQLGLRLKNQRRIPLRRQRLLVQLQPHRNCRQHRHRHRHHQHRHHPRAVVRPQRPRRSTPHQGPLHIEQRPKGGTMNNSSFGFSPSLLNPKLE